MTTETKNTTAIERRIARRAKLAEELRGFAAILNRHGYDSQPLREAAAQLHIANADDILAQPWAADQNPAKPTFALAAQLMREMQPDLERAVDGMVRAFTDRTKPEGPACQACGYPGQVYQEERFACPNCHGEGLDDVVQIVPEITDAMVARALDGWEQWWNGYPLPSEKTARRYAMRHALAQALGVPRG
jgi:hypothetical protein